MSTETEGPRRRRGVRRVVGALIGKRTAENRYRDVLLLLVVGLVVWALAVNQDTLDKVQHGRQTALAVTCAVLSATSEAGRATITGSSLQETPFTRALEKLGYPPLRQRAKQAALAGKLYVKAINDRVEHELRERGKSVPRGLIRADGTMDCRVFTAISDAPLPPLPANRKR